VVGFGLLVTAVVVGGALLLISLARTFPVTLVVAGQAREIDTHPDTVAGLLESADVTLSEGDQVSPALDTPLDVGLVVRVERARSVFLTVDGASTPLWTPLTNPAEILASAGVRVDAGDRIVIDGTTSHLDQLAQWPVPVSRIEVRHSIEVRVHDEGGTQTLHTTSGTVGEALFDAGITLYLTDTTTPDLNTALTHDLDVTITRARPVEIIADGGTIETRSRGNTVAAALVDAGVTLVGMDYAVPAEGTPLRPGMTIRVIRVREDVEAQQQPLDFETVYQADASMELDTERVSQQGEPGVQETRVRVRYENGIAVSRSEQETVIVRAPINRVISYGTNVVLRTIDTPDGPREYWRKVRMYVTSYHPVAGDNITATGRTLQRGIVGADTRVLPFGSQIYVPGYGVGDVQDTGPRRSSMLWIDLGYTNEDYQGWHAYYDVYWLTPVPANIDYTLPAS
jgi:uncharacterized protein YabE (DUF348 family)/3D (Asp-Asp-Asp) domain-containing protein